MRRSRRISYLTQSYETNSGQEKGARGMRSSSSWIGIDGLEITP